MTRLAVALVACAAWVWVVAALYRAWWSHRALHAAAAHRAVIKWRCGLCGDDFPGLNAVRSHFALRHTAAPVDIVDS